MTGLILPPRVLPAGLIAALDAAGTSVRRLPWVELGWPGLDPKNPCLDIFLFDDSGSVTSPHGNDPVGGRFQEAAKVIQLVADWSMSSRSKIAVLHFDDPVGSSGVHALNEKRLLSQLAPSLRTPLSGCGTSHLSPSLGTAERLAKAHADADVRLTIFSDFELTDRDPAPVLSRLTSFPGSVHAVVLGGNPPLDLAASGVTVTPLSSQDPPGSFAAALHTSLTATRRGRRYSVLHAAGRNEPLS
jgi:hypothetical protein